MSSAAVLIDKGKLASASTAVVKKEEFSALLEARDIVAQAHRYGETLKAGMHEQVAAARRAGYEAGMKEARTDFSATVVSTVAEMETAFARLELRIVNTVMGALQQILGRIDDRTLMEQLVRRVLGQSRQGKELRLRVSAAQFDEVNRWLSDVIKEFPDIEFVDVVKDASAAPGT